MKSRLLCGLVTVLSFACSGSDSSRSLVSPSGPATEIPGPQLQVAVDGMPGAVAILQASEVSFDASANADKLRVQLDFGDGDSTTERVATHVYRSSGVFTARLTLTDSVGRQTSTSTTVDVQPFGGTWYAAGINVPIHKFEYRRIAITRQSGADVQGIYSAFGQPDRSLSGRISSGRRFDVSLDGGAERFSGDIPREWLTAPSLMLRAAGGTVDGQTIAFAAVPSSPSTAPPYARLEVRSGIAGQTIPHVGLETTFDATRSSGDQLAYFVSYGDDLFTSDATSQHVFMKRGAYRAQLTVVDRFGRIDQHSDDVTVDAFAPMSIERYQNFYSNPVTGRHEERRIVFTEQNGSFLRGYYMHPEDSGRPSLPDLYERLTATLIGSNRIHIRLDNGTIDFQGYVAQPTVGTVNLGETLVLTVKGGSADGVELAFRLTDPY